MINIIKYYYNLDDISFVTINNKKYIKYKNKLYQFIKIYNIDYIKFVYNISSKYEKYEKIIPNKKNSIFTKYDGNIYILKEKKESKENYPQTIILKDIKNNIIMSNENWDKQWSKKIDYIEKEYEKIKGKISYIDESIYYYIGMAENAISYFKNNIKDKKFEKSLCRRKMKQEDYYNPLNIVIDNKARDIAEYIKENYYSHTVCNKQIELLIQKTADKNECILIYSRLLFPNYYFDECINIINKQLSQIKNIIAKADQYESYLNEIYRLMKIKYNDIEEIKWIKKKQN